MIAESCQNPKPPEVYMRTKKTVRFENIASKANFDIIVGTYVHGKKDNTRAKWDAMSSLMLSYDGYAGFGYHTDTTNIKNMLNNYEYRNLYSDAEIQMVIDAYTADLNRIADMWYNDTGNALPDIVDDGIVKDQQLYSEWISFSAPHFEQGNWVFLF